MAGRRCHGDVHPQNARSRALAQNARSRALAGRPGAALAPHAMTPPSSVTPPACRHRKPEATA